MPTVLPSWLSVSSQLVHTIELHPEADFGIKALYFVNTDFRTGVGQRYDPAATIPDFRNAGAPQCNRP